MVDSEFDHRRLPSADCVLLDIPTAPRSSCTSTYSTRIRRRNGGAGLLPPKACFSYAAYACQVIAHLRNCRVPVARGLSEEEFDTIQSQFGICFPPDLKSILQEGLPVGHGFPNWRSPKDDKQLLDLMDLPSKWLQSHHISRWWPQESRPSCRNAEEASFLVARDRDASVPCRLIPIYSHCYIPCTPNQAGNPVFLVFNKKDLLYCGYDLADFFGREIFVPFRALQLDNYIDLPISASVSQLQEQKMIDNPPLDPSPAGKEASIDSRRSADVLKDHDAVDDTDYFGPKEVRQRRYHGGHGLDLDDSADDDIDDDMCFELENQQQPLLELQQQCISTARNFDKSCCCSGSSCCQVHEISSAGRKESTVLSTSSRRRHVSQDGQYFREPSSTQRIVSRYAYIHKQTLPDRVRARFTIGTPPWAAKLPRHIPFWSDLVQGKENAQFVYNTSPLLDLEKSTTLNRPAPIMSSTAAAATVDGVKASSRKTWLESYLKDMERSLRSGGWKEEEIEAMIVDVVPSGGGGRKAIASASSTGISSSRSRAEMKGVLMEVAEAMVRSLQQAGWGSQEAMDILNFKDEGGAIGRQQVVVVVGTGTKPAAAPLPADVKTRPCLGDLLRCNKDHRFSS